MKLPLEKFLEAPGILFDARSPSEQLQGKIPGALPLPILNDEQRAQVGTCYKQEGRAAAVELGFRLTGPHLADLIARARDLCDGSARVYCWRGGMRSELTAMLLNAAEIHTVILDGGYKAFRTATLNTFADLSGNLRVLGGLTGSGKTHILHALEAQGQQTLDLEGLANHRGSSYGAIGMSPQPTTEQFENLIAWQWRGFDKEQTIWIEDESRKVGRCQIPNQLYALMQESPTFVIERPKSERIDIIEKDYGNGDRELLAEGTRRIQRKLGGVRSQQALEMLENGDFRGFVDVVLDYYDRTYASSITKRSDHVVSHQAAGLTAEEWATKATGL